MNRRQVVGGLVASGALIGAGGLFLRRGDIAPDALTIDAVLQSLAAIADQPLTSDGSWSVSQVLVHCAQSVEYSLDGFPSSKSQVFQSTIGATAFAVFAKRGRMRHRLNDPIPGAPALPQGVPMAQAVERLRNGLLRFEQHTGKLAAHFAYGALSKSDYALAHAMHWRNHLDELRVAT